MNIEEQFEQYKKALPVCIEHQPDGGARATCLVCACISYSNALSRISYLCGEPNEYEVSNYDMDCDEDNVVKDVQKLAARKDPEVLELAYCETKTLLLHPDRLYRFTYHADCPACARLKDQHDTVHSQLP